MKNSNFIFLFLVSCFLFLLCKEPPDISKGKWFCEKDDDCLNGFFCDKVQEICKKKELKDIFEAQDIVSEIEIPLDIKDAKEIEIEEKGIILKKSKINCSSSKLEGEGYKLKGKICPFIFHGESNNNFYKLKSKVYF